ncbi:MAG: CoA transferase [Rhodospirillaceae bacterium]|jgi:crotonobetainyl-CoA:carnitine CoA-transferase CaiB-like acyl-CoA transferase|nr:CoA transferase [Rhodospirillaceae bacterium]MBT3491521.1 CoA transferase [Rhodospirillaceae bacterium]MBT3778460.1 CoA transferase [Rhodospirillaceae bacterium]MBT3976059.1 CoA transferase [Rhodospirillaceae bacterium]MBT4169976.1 CoA transferase [Rhodospirillaceae bacterium]
MTQAFEGIRVIDFSQVLAGPFAAGQLALLGADVIKIEQPGVGDQMRAMMSTEELAAIKLAPAYLGVNTNKRAITVDLKSAAAKEILHRLLAGADVVIQNFKGGVIDRLGYGYEDVCAIKPDIIYCSISGYGQQGPMAGKAAYDGAIQAASGMMSVTGTPDSGPLRVGYMPVDISTGITASYAIASALFRRSRTGEGQHLDVSMLDSAMTMLNPVISNYLIGGMEPKRLGNISPTYQGSGDTWATKDGYLQMTVITDTMAKKMCAAFDRPELMDDPRFATDKGRVDHREAVRAEIGAILNTETTAVWMQRLGAAGVPVGPVHDMGELMDFPQLEHRGILMTLPAPQGMQGEITVPGAGFHASGGEPSGKTAGPVLGQHTDEVLGELGYDAAAIQAFRDDGII